MNKIKFTKDEGSLFYKEFTKKVDQYFKQNQLPTHGTKTMVIKIILYFSLNLLFYMLMITSSHVSWFYVFYLLMGLSVLLTAFNISHDAAHGVAVRSKWLNKLLFGISFNLQGNNAYVWGKNHNASHHLYTNIEGSDIDVLHHPLLRMTNKQPLRWFHRYQYVYAPWLYLFYSLNWFLFRETLMLFDYTNRTITIHIPKVEILKLILYKLAYLMYMIVLPAWVLPYELKYILLAFLFNHFLISLLFVAVLGVSHLSDHVIHPIPDANNTLSMSWPKLQFCTSVDYHTQSVCLNWLLGGFNAHTLHHLLPTVCHIHYPKLLPIFREVAEKYKLHYNEVSYLDALRSHIRFLKKMGSSQTNIRISHAN